MAGGFSLSPTMDAIAKTIRDAGLADNVYAYEPKSYQPPCVIVHIPAPGQVQFNKTFKHGMYGATLEVDFIVGDVFGLEARNALSDILDGAASIAVVLEAKDSALGAVVDTVAVSDAGIVRISGPTPESELLAARFTVELGGH